MLYCKMLIRGKKNYLTTQFSKDFRACMPGLWWVNERKISWFWIELKMTLQDLFCSGRQTKEGKTGTIVKKGIFSPRMITILQDVEMQSEKSAAALTSINSTEACSGIKIMKNANSRSLLIPSLVFPSPPPPPKWHIYSFYFNVSDYSGDNYS